MLLNNSIYSFHFFFFFEIEFNHPLKKNRKKNKMVFLDITVSLLFSSSYLKFKSNCQKHLFLKHLF